MKTGASGAEEEKIVFSQRGGRLTALLADEQIRRWRLAKEAKEKAQKAKAADGSAGAPLVCISREFGARGAAVGRLVAEELGFSFWDRELIHALAKEEGVPVEVVEAVDERRTNALHETLGGTWIGPSATQTTYMQHLRSLLHELDRVGGAVVVGRGAGFFLSPERALRVRIVCPVDVRVRGYALREGLEEKVVERRLESIERDRRCFIKRQFGADINDARQHDMMLNTGTMAGDICVDLIVGAYRNRFAGPAAAE